jgi:two-component system chemotaxis response regulator CheY
MRRILAVDDSRTLREMLTNCLTGAGHQVFTARDGAEGLVALRECRPDIVITDLNMPVMNGLEFIAAARAEEAGRGLPLLLLTTEIAGELKLRAREVGATGWLTKPFNGAHVLGLIDQLA